MLKETPILRHKYRQIKNIPLDETAAKRRAKHKLISEKYTLSESPKFTIEASL
jgi:hypothetical protein